MKQTSAACKKKKHLKKNMVLGHLSDLARKFYNMSSVMCHTTQVLFHHRLLTPGRECCLFLNLFAWTAVCVHLAVSANLWTQLSNP